MKAFIGFGIKVGCIVIGYATMGNQGILLGALMGLGLGVILPLILTKNQYH